MNWVLGVALCGLLGACVPGVTYDAVLARSSGDVPVTEDELLTLAASVEQTDEATWDAFVIEAAGGPGLHPDEGRVEVARGSVGKIEWLLQDGPATGGILATEPDDDPDLSQIDTCLKLSDRTRTCADAVQTSPNGTIATIDDDAVDGNGDTSIGDVAIVSTTQDGASLRATTATSVMQSHIPTRDSANNRFRSGATTSRARSAV